MAMIEIDDDLYHQMELLFAAVAEEGGVPALNMTTYANAALAVALAELLENPDTYALCVALAAERGEDWEAMTERLDRLITHSAAQIGAQAESRDNALAAEGNDSGEM